MILSMYQKQTRNNMKRSFLKWVGGKYNAIPKIKKHFPMTGGVLVEPFMGSCTFALNSDYERFILNDYNPDLVNLCRWAATKPCDLISKSRELFVPSNNSEKVYYEIRDKYNRSRDEEERALLFFFLNRHGHKGLVRYNLSGLFNSPFGHYKSPRFPGEEIIDFSSHLKKARFVCGGFQNLKFRGGMDVDVYADPPYLPKSRTASFSSYTELGFSRDFHLKLNKKAVDWRSRTNSVVLSNIHVPVLKECYPNALRTVSIDVRHNIATNAKIKEPAKEVLLFY